MIYAFAVRFDLRKRKPCRLERALRIELSLIEIVWRFRVGVLSKNQQRTGSHLGSEFDYADEGCSSDSVTALLSLLGPSIEVVDDPNPSRSAGNRKARPLIAELLHLSA